jgi:hypothetical protein
MPLVGFVLEATVPLVLVGPTEALAAAAVAAVPLPELVSRLESAEIGFDVTVPIDIIVPGGLRLSPYRLPGW